MPENTPSNDPIEAVIATLMKGESLLTVATTIGALCLRCRSRIEEDSYADRTDLVTSVSASLRTELTNLWTADGQPTGAPTEAIPDIIKKLKETPDLAAKITLEALCHGPLTSYFNTVYDVVELVRGSVFPLPTRKLSWPATTPNPVATTHHHPCCPPGFQIWDHDQIVHLDYRYRDGLDEVCWKPVGPDLNVLAKIAAVAPFSACEMSVPPANTQQGTIFGVGPLAAPANGENRDTAVLARVYGALEQVRAVSPDLAICVLPECSLHKADLLGLLDEDKWSSIAPLIVAGSAHEKVDGLNCNRSITYYKGIPIIEHYKRVPYRRRDAVEEIASPDAITVCSGTTSRLAVAICADLNTTWLLTIYAALGVNLLLVPSWSPKVGTFGVALGTIAGYCQGIGLIANGPKSDGDTAAWFFAISVVPREEPEPIFHRPPTDSQPLAGIFDPNVPPDEAEYWTWEPS